MRMHPYAAVPVGLLLTASALGCSTYKPAAPAAVKVTRIDVGRSVAADKTIAEKTASFRPADTFHVSVATDGSGPSATLTARWTYEDGQVVDESRQSISPTGSATVTEFHLSKPDGWPAGAYKVEVLLNGSSAGTREFTVT
jgi:large exoprotein involved in heme utilization and adhesion